MHDAVTHRKMRVLALVPSTDAFRRALEKAGGCKPGDHLPDGCDVVEVQEEVSGGCVCCTVRRDIEDVLADEALAGVPSFDLVIIDTASSSDPMPVIATLFEEHANEVVTPEVSQHFHLDAVVCVVDGRATEASGSPGKTVHDARQVAFADVIVVSRPQLGHDGVRAAAAAVARHAAGGTPTLALANAPHNPDGAGLAAACEQVFQASARARDAACGAGAAKSLKCE